MSWLPKVKSVKIWHCFHDPNVFHIIVLHIFYWPKEVQTLLIIYDLSRPEGQITWLVSVIVAVNLNFIWWWESLWIRRQVSMSKVSRIAGALEELWGSQQGRANVVCSAWQAVCNVSSQMLEPLKAGLHSDWIANALQWGSDFQWKWWENLSQRTTSTSNVYFYFSCDLHCLQIAFIQ